MIRNLKKISLFLLGIRNNCQSNGRNALSYLFFEWMIKLTVVIIEKYQVTTTNKTLCNILLSELTPYAGKITVDHQCGYRRNRSTTDQIFSVHQKLEKNCSIMGQYIRCS
jgi:hypothetical protein